MSRRTNVIPEMHSLDSAQLAGWLQENNVTQASLADFVGVSRHTVNRMVRGAYPVSPAVAVTVGLIDLLSPGKKQKILEDIRSFRPQLKAASGSYNR